jgi:hypothetical protein
VPFLPQVRPLRFVIDAADRRLPASMTINAQLRNLRSAVLADSLVVSTRFTAGPRLFPPFYF